MRSRYTNLKDKLTEGQWIFTCSMQPLQFSHFRGPKNLADYDKSWLQKSKEEQEDFAFDDFVTLGGSSHSIHNCSCKPISEKYAKWFIENKCADLYDTFEIEDDGGHWVKYEEAVKKLAEKDGLEFEGI